MKYRHIERVRVKLRLLSPTHIGSGEKMGKKEMIYDKVRNRLLIPSMPDMIDFFAVRCPPKTLERYEYFLQQNTPEDLGSFLTRNYIRTDPLPDWIQRSVCVGADIRRVNDLSLSVCNPEGRAYIPGSSVKGAMRTALIAARMTESERVALAREFRENSRYEMAADSILRKLRADERRPAEPVNDILKGLSVSDSAPFAREDMVICQRLDLGIGEYEPKGLSTYSECIAPDSETDFYISIDHNILPSAFLKELEQALQFWDDLCYNSYDALFENGGSDLADTSCWEGIPLRLGADTGFQTHSLVYRAFDGREAVDTANRILQNNFKYTYKPKPNVQAAPYRQKVTMYDGKLYTMGRCEMILT